MKKFADLGIKPLEKGRVFHVPVISITDVLNTEIEVLDFEPGVSTQHGDDRYIVKVRVDGEEQKFFTTAAPIKEALDRVGKENFPFSTIVKKKKLSNNSSTFYFT